MGNRFRGDDGIGPYMVDALKKEDLPSVQCVEHRGEGVDLITMWQDYQSVWVADAVQSDET